MFFVKLLSILNVLLLEDLSIRFLENAWPCFTAKPVPNCVTEYSGNEKKYNEPVNVYRDIPRKNARGEQCTGSKEEAIAWEEEANKEA